jgi:hypothetical protein
VANTWIRDGAGSPRLKRRLWRTASHGGLVDRCTGDAYFDDPALGPRWDHRPTIRAEVLTQFLIDDKRQTPHTVKLAERESQELRTLKHWQMIKVSSHEP